MIICGSALDITVNDDENSFIVCLFLTVRQSSVIFKWNGEANMLQKLAKI